MKKEPEKNPEKKLHRARINVEWRKGKPPVIRWVQGYTKEEIEKAKEKKRREYEKEVGREIRRAAVTRQKASPLFGVYAEQWFRLYKEPHLRPSSVMMYRNILDTHLIPAFGDRRLIDITRSDVQAMINGKAEKSHSLITKIKATICQIMESARDDGLIERTPTTHIRLPQGTRGTVLPVPHDAVQALAAHCKACPDGLLPLLLMYTGLRRGEALGLRWADITEDTITVRRAVWFDKNQPVVGLPKTKAAFRSVPLLPAVAELLPPRGDPQEYLFGGAEPWTECRFARTWERIQKAVPELRGVHPHQLRHTYADILRNAGVNTLTAQYFLGHEDYETTANIYSQVNQTDLSRAREQLGALREIAR